MSGFAGIVCTDGGSPDERLLKAMAEALEFRGPDGTAIRTVPGMGACFTFLRTGPAPQAAQQPCSLDGTTWLLGSVRLDGREELRDALRQKHDSVPENASDEELALLAWRQWKEESFARLQGDFAFAIWDSPAKKLYCARDMIGPRPFFYARCGKRIYFSNTLDILRMVPEISPEVDPTFIGDFLLQGWCADAERTAFRGIRRLPPGHLLEFSNAEVMTRLFFTLPIDEPLFLKRPEEYVEEFRRHFRNAVKDRVPREGASVFLSGGLDSTSVAGEAVRLMAQNLLTNIRAVTLDCRPLFEDEEGKLASKAAAQWGIPIEVVSMDTQVPYSSWDHPEVRTPEPTSEPFQTLHMELYGLAAAGARVALTGDGGDVLLTGQARNYLWYLLRRGNWGRAVSGLSKYILTNRRLPPLRTGIRGKLRRWLGQKDFEPVFPEWIQPQFEKELHLKDRWKKLNEPPAKSEHPLHPQAHASLSSPYWALLLEDEDVAWTGVPVETRTPFLDLRLIRFLLRVPPLPWCMEKELLRQATRGILPEEIRLRPKVPLLEDPLPLLMERGLRNPAPLGRPGAKSSEYVDWQKVPATSAGDTGSTLVEKMRPAALENWLKGVEKQRGIQ
jgi:asparagine synthase (glutamine-hydrolysing)